MTDDPGTAPSNRQVDHSQERCLVPERAMGPVESQLSLGSTKGETIAPGHRQAERFTPRDVTGEDHPLISERPGQSLINGLTCQAAFFKGKVHADSLDSQPFEIVQSSRQQGAKMTPAAGSECGGGTGHDDNPGIRSPRRPGCHAKIVGQILEAADRLNARDRCRRQSPGGNEPPKETSNEDPSSPSGLLDKNL